MFANGPLAKTSHLATARHKGCRNRFCLLMGEAANHIAYKWTCAQEWEEFVTIFAFYHISNVNSYLESACSLCLPYIMQS